MIWTSSIKAGRSAFHKHICNLPELSRIGCYNGVTAEGSVIDERWQENDGLVNTVSALAPIGALQKLFDRKHIEKGIWNVMPVFDGDHMPVQGGLFHRRVMRWFCLDLPEMCRQPER